MNSKFVCHEDENYHTCERITRGANVNDMRLRAEINHSPMTRKNEQKTIVKTMNQVFHEWLLLTVATPRNMKIIVSEELLNIFKAYFIVVWDLCDILAST